MICDQLPATLLLPAVAGQPTKNERPHHPPSGHPERHLAADATADASAEISRDARIRRINYFRKEGPHPESNPGGAIKEPLRAPNSLCSRQLTGPSRLPLRADLRPGLDRPVFSPHGA